MEFEYKRAGYMTEGNESVEFDSFGKAKRDDYMSRFCFDFMV